MVLNVLYSESVCCALWGVWVIIIRIIVTIRFFNCFIFIRIIDFILKKVYKKNRHFIKLHYGLLLGFKIEVNVRKITWKTSCSVSMFNSICMRKSMARKTAVTKTGNVTLQFHASFVRNKNDLPNVESIISSGCEKSKYFVSRNKFEHTAINQRKY